MQQESTQTQQDIGVNIVMAFSMLIGWFHRTIVGKSLLSGLFPAKFFRKTHHNAQQSDNNVT